MIVTKVWYFIILKEKRKKGPFALIILHKPSKSIGLFCLLTPQNKLVNLLIIFVGKQIAQKWCIFVSSLSDFTRWNHAWPDPALFQMQSVHKESTEYNITPFTDSKCLCKKPQTAQVFSLVATKHPCSLATEWQGQNSPLSGVYSNYLPHYCRERQSVQEMR